MRKVRTGGATYGEPSNAGMSFAALFAKWMDRDHLNVAVAAPPD